MTVPRLARRAITEFHSVYPSNFAVCTAIHSEFRWGVYCFIIKINGLVITITSTCQHTTGRWIERDTLQSEIMLIIITSTQGLVEYKRIFPPSSTELGYVSVCSNWTQPIWYDQLQTTPEGRPRGESPLLELLIEMTEPLCLLQFCTLWIFLQYCYLLSTGD